jgi:hypothetical protein
MRTIITAIVVWAILIGIFVTGVKIMASAPGRLIETAVKASGDDDRNRLEVNEPDARQGETVRQPDEGVGQDR